MVPFWEQRHISGTVHPVQLRILIQTAPVISNEKGQLCMLLSHTSGWGFLFANPMGSRPFWETTVQSKLSPPTPELWGWLLELPSLCDTSPFTPPRPQITHSVLSPGPSSLTLFSKHHHILVCCGSALCQLTFWVWKHIRKEKGNHFLWLDFIKIEWIL